MSTGLDNGIYGMYDNAKQTNELLNAIGITTDSTKDTIISQSVYNRDASDRAALGLRNAIEGNATVINGNINRTSDQLQRDAAANNVSALLAVERNGANIYSQVQRTGGDIGVSIERTSGNNNTLIASAQSQLATQAERIGGETRLGNALNHASIVENFKETLVQQAAQAERTRYSSLEQQSNNTLRLQELGLSVAQQFDSTKSHIASAAANSIESSNKAISEVKDVKYDLSKQAGDYFAKNQMDMVKVENSLGRQSDLQFANLNQRVGDYSAKTSLEIAKSEASISKQSALEAASIQMEAMKNQLLLQKQMSDCCCEIKEKISESSDKTNDLINTINNDHYRDNLIESREASLLLATRSRHHHGGHRRHH